MMRARLAVLSLGVLGSAMASIVACGGSPPDLPLGGEQVDKLGQASTVAIEMQDATGAKLGSCSGVLVSRELVLTAGHCVVTAKKFKITASAVDKSSTSSIAVTPWKNFQSSWSHPNQADIALLRLDKAIELDSYPKIATGMAKGDQDATRIGRSAANGEAGPIGVTLSPGKTKGMKLTYTAGKADTGFLDTGGPVLDDAGRILGVVSGRGTKSGLLYVTRVDLFAKWIGQSQSCASDLEIKTWGGNPWGGNGSSSGGGGGGWGGGGGAPGWWGGGSFGGYGGTGGEIDAGTLAPLADGGSIDGTGTSSSSSGGVNGGTTSGGPGGDNGNLTNAPGSCPPVPNCIGNECATSGSSDSGGTTSSSSGGPGGGSGDVFGGPNGLDNPDGDFDGDGIPNGKDTLPTIPGKPGDMDGDGIPDSTDALPTIPGKPGDRDGDGIPDSTDKQPDVPNGGGTPDKCPGDEICPPAEPDTTSCVGPNCGGCTGQAGCVDDMIDYGDCACTKTPTTLR